MIRTALAALALLALAACNAVEMASPPAEVARAAYVHDAPPSLTLITVINERTDRGGHTALMVNGSQRVIFDPAGTFNDTLPRPERGDVVYGITPNWYLSYLDYHVRDVWRTHTHTVEVTPEVAEAALRLVQAHGPAAKATCARATSAILAQVPGFEDTPRGWYPIPLMEDFAARPGVIERVWRDGDPGLPSSS